MNKRVKSIRENRVADAPVTASTLETINLNRTRDLIRSTNVFVLLALLIISLGCSGPMKPGTSPLGHLMSATLRPASNKQANAQIDDANPVAGDDNQSAGEVALATYVQSEPPPATIEELPIPDVPQNFERIEAAQSPGMHPPSNHHYSTHSELPPLRSGHQPRAGMGSRMESSTNSAIKMRGDLLRSPNETATEISLRQQKIIALLEHQIENGKAERQELLRQLSDERREHKRTDSKLANGLKEILRLRKMTAKLQVQIDDLLVTNQKIREDSEAALQAIESNLDAALFQKISGNGQN